MITKQARKVAMHLLGEADAPASCVGSTPTLLLVALVCCSGCRAAAPAGAERPTSTLALEIEHVTSQLRAVGLQLCHAANQAAIERGLPTESCAQFTTMEGRP